MSECHYCGMQTEVGMHFEGKPICDDCVEKLDYETVLCCECGKVMAEDSDGYIGDDTLDYCLECFSSSGLRRCSNCEQLLECREYEDSGEYVCDECKDIWDEEKDYEADVRYLYGSTRGI